MPLDRALYFHGERVRLRPYRAEDASTFQSWINDPEIQRLIGGHGWQFSLPAARAFVGAHQGNDWAHGFAFAIDETDLEEAPRLIGSVELRKLQPVERRGEIDILIGDHEFWRRGYGEDAMPPSAASGSATWTCTAWR
ncbi:MAG: N-acetyltransferase [Dehalococcoidia bacterium]|nr:N-acetyltransferase [Dehalococcoidia bacterium]